MQTGDAMLYTRPSNHAALLFMLRCGARYLKNSEKHGPAHEIPPAGSFPVLGVPSCSATQDAAEADLSKDCRGLINCGPSKA